MGQRNNVLPPSPEHILLSFDGHSMFLKNAGNKLPEFMASYLRRQQISAPITVRNLQILLTKISWIMISGAL
jgi:hypothetical protein